MPRLTVHELTLRESREIDAQYPYVPNADQCHDEAKTGGRFYTCTRPAGHDGPHVAHAPKGPVATWERASC